MARQKGVLNLDGKAGTLSFFQGRDGYGARTSDGMKGERIAEEEAFARTRENGMEFGRAGKAGKVLRAALRELFVGVADRRMTSRMTREMLKVVQSDPISDRGYRTASKGNALLLEGFEFNVNNPLQQTFFPPFQTSIDRTTGTGQVSLASYNPVKLIVATKGATHYCFLLAIVSANFDEGKSTQKMLISEAQDLKVEKAERVLTVSLPESSEFPLFLIFGIEFFQMVNGKKYPLKDTSHNALTIVAVDSDSDI